jgi:hypothetical protein
LRDLLPQRLEGLFVRPHEPALPDGGGGLFLRQVLGIGREAELLDAGDDGAGRDDKHVAAACFQRGNVGGELLDPLGAQAGALGSHQAASDLDDHPLRVFQETVSHAALNVATRSPT